jgi:hypothetical protein
MQTTTGRHAATSTITLINTQAAADHQRTMTITVVRNGMVDAAERDVDVAVIEIGNNEGLPTYQTERLVGRELDEYIALHLTQGWSLQF